MSTAGAVGSIVIPAWNEATVIERTLDTLFAGLDDDVRVVVACNGCTDDTADRARTSGHAVTVLELGSVGKAGAIRAAEDAAPELPRLYLDADTDLTGRAANAVLAALAGGAIAARPPIAYQDQRSSWLVRRYYAARRRLPGVATDLCGAGVYGLSATARARFARFPDVRGDDLFAARVVGHDEVVIVDTDPVRVHVPRSARDQIRVLARQYRGAGELADALPDVARATASSTARDLLRLAPSRHAIDMLVYVGFVAAGRLTSRREAGQGWSRDQSARSADR